jgi:hypothetical protein
MRKIIYILIYIFLGINIFGQSRCNCQAMVDWQYQGQVYIYDKVDGIIIDSISNDSLNEDFVVMSISDFQKGFFHVRLQHTIKEISKCGWIKANKYIGTYARNYEDDIILNLYVDPEKNSKVETNVSRWIPELYEITDCKGNWLKVRLNYVDKSYSGWLEKEMQCANPYTTCN